MLGSWPRTLLVVSHDRELLERVDRIGELRDGAVRWYGGGFSSYADQVEAEQEAAEQAVTAASSDLRRQQADRVEAERLLAQRKRQGERNAVRTNMGKAARDFYKNRSEKHAASYRKVHDERLEAAQDRLDEAEARLREDRTIRVDLPATEVPRGRVVLTTDELVIRTGAAVELDLRGPDRVAVTGPNGAGKTTLLDTIIGTVPPRSGSVRTHVPDRAAPAAARRAGPRALGRRQRRRSRARPRGESRSAPSWPGSCSAARPPTSRSARSRAASGSAPPWPPCCWPTRRRSCSCSTSRPTTSTSRRTTRWCRA